MDVVGQMQVRVEICIMLFQMLTKIQKAQIEVLQLYNKKNIVRIILIIMHVVIVILEHLIVKIVSI